MRTGDIIIYEDYFESEKNGEYKTDRFHVITNNDLFQYRGHDSTPVGIVVHSPKDYIPPTKETITIPKEQHRLTDFNK